MPNPQQQEEEKKSNASLGDIVRYAWNNFIYGLDVPGAWIQENADSGYNKFGGRASQRISELESKADTSSLKYIGGIAKIAGVTGGFLLMPISYAVSLLLPVFHYSGPTVVGTAEIKPVVSKPDKNEQELKKAA